MDSHRTATRHVSLPMLLGIAGGLSAGIAVFLGIYGITHDSIGRIQVQNDYGRLIFPHFFEHSLGYLLVSVAAPFFYLFYARINSHDHSGPKTM